MERQTFDGGERLRRREGEHYLELLGMSDQAQQSIPGRPQLQMRDFLEICGDHAQPAFYHLETLDSRSSEYQDLRAAMIQLVTNVLNPRQ